MHLEDFEDDDRRWLKKGSGVLGSGGAHPTAAAGGARDAEHLATGQPIGRGVLLRRRRSVEVGVAVGLEDRQRTTLELDGHLTHLADRNEGSAADHRTLGKHDASDDTEARARTQELVRSPDEGILAEPVDRALVVHEEVSGRSRVPTERDAAASRRNLVAAVDPPDASQSVLRGPELVHLPLGTKGRESPEDVGHLARGREVAPLVPSKNGDGRPGAGDEEPELLIPPPQMGAVGAEELAALGVLDAEDDYRSPPPHRHDSLEGDALAPELVAGLGEGPATCRHFHLHDPAPTDLAYCCITHLC